MVERFQQLLRLPNVTGDTDALRRCAAAIVELFGSVGATLRVVELEAAGPMVIGRVDVDPRLPTVGIYVHFDGQPVNEPAWRSDPFDPVLLDPDGRRVTPGGAGPPDPELRVYARGSADDRAPLIALAEALGVLRAAGRRPAVNLALCFEGEEEHGSPNLGRYLRAHRDELAADAWWICDGPMHQSGRPQVVCGVRGFAGFELTVYGPVRELHSGHYGNWVPNPAQVLVEALASCKSNGRIEIEGFDDCASPVTETDRAAIDRLPMVEPSLLTELGLAAPERATPLFETVLSSSFNIRGLHAGTVAPETRNVIPATARASVDLRLAAGVDPDTALDQVTRHLERLGITIIDQSPTPEQRRRHPRLATLVRTAAYPGIRVPTDAPLVGHATAVAARASGLDPVVVPSLGGSVPFHHLRAELGVDGVIVPIANHDNNQHAANENLRLANLAYGIELFIALLGTPAPFGEKPAPG